MHSSRKLFAAAVLVAMLVVVASEECNDRDCPFTPCVNRIRVAGNCCPVCPGGQNCYGDKGHIIFGTKDHIMNGKRCRCATPDEEGYNEHASICVPL